MVELPTLYSATKTGKVQVWRVWTRDDVIFTEHGQLDGKLQQSRKTAQPKNVGRSNETTALEQAEIEAKAMWVKREKGKYTVKKPDSPEAIEEMQNLAASKALPMLAHKFLEKDGSLSGPGKKVSYPVDMQPKINGVRALARWVTDTKGLDVVRLSSREGNKFHLPHLSQQLEKWLPHNMELDGEVYIHGMPLADIVSLVTDFRTESFNLKYFVYDAPVVGENADLSWQFRREALRMVRKSPSVRRVDCVEATNFEEVLAFSHGFIELGFEGGILRRRSGKYSYGHRSRDLLKVKFFQDEEFEVVGCNEGEGKDEGTAIFVCMNNLPVPEGVDPEFSARMKGSLAQRQKYWEERDSYIGRMLTVNFFERTNKNKPHLGVGIAFQEDR